MKTAFAAFFLLLALALGACGGSGASATPATGSSASATPAAVESSAPSAAVTGTPVIVKDFTLDPLDVAVAGSASLDVTNAGPTVHNATVRNDAGDVLVKTADLREGEAETLTVDLPAGTYILFCSLPGHESLGMKGTLTVTE